MGFRISLCVALACLAIVVAAGAPTAPARAGGSDISYNEVTRLLTGNQPAPGTYANGSFDGDFQAATQKKKNGLFGMITNTMNMMKNGFASTSYYLNNMEREDSFQDDTATITLPDKNQIIHLDLGKKTYWINTPSTGKMETMPPMVPNQSTATMPPQQPGTAKVTVTVTTRSLGSIDVGGSSADGYYMSFKIVSTNATGSCTNGTFETSVTEYLSSYAEPSIKWPSKPMKMPQMPMMKNPEFSSFKPGCTPKVSATTHIGPVAPSGRLVVWEILSMSASGMANGQAMGGGAGILLERGDIKPLSSGDSGLFAPPAGFTQVQPPQ